MTYLYFSNAGGNSTIPVSPQFETCSKMRRAFHYNKNGKEAVDALYEYTKRNLLWLNVYVKVCNYWTTLTTSFKNTKDKIKILIDKIGCLHFLFGISMKMHSIFERQPLQREFLLKVNQDTCYFIEICFWSNSNCFIRRNTKLNESL